MAQGGMRLRQRPLDAAKIAAAIAVAVLGACAEPAARPAPAPRVLVPPSPPSPPPVLTPPRPPPPPPDACGARKLQYLIGRPHTDIPVPVYPSRRQVVCSTCVMSQEYVPSRLTIIYDSNTDLVKSVRCG